MKITPIVFPYSSMVGTVMHDKYNWCLTLFQASDSDDGRYAPAESFVLSGLPSLQALHAALTEVLQDAPV